MHREPAVVVCDLARLPCRERPGREQRRSNNEETTADFTRHHEELLLWCVAGLQSLYSGSRGSMGPAELCYRMEDELAVLLASAARPSQHRDQRRRHVLTHPLR